jgi:tight adherence protein C
VSAAPSTGLLVGMVVGAAVVAARPRRRRLPARVIALCPVRPARPVGRRPAAVAALFGGVVRRALLRPPDTEADTVAGAAVLAGLALAAVHPALGAAAAAAVVGRPWLIRRRAERRHARQVREAVPDLIDLFRFAATGGLNVRLAVDAVAPRAGEPLRAPLEEVRRRVALGDRVADAIDDVLTRVGGPVGPLAAVLAHAEREGVALAPSLEHVADDARLERRRTAEEDARRLPVRLLFPLVGCILPAFVLLTIVPLLAGSFASLPR